MRQLLADKVSGNLIGLWLLIPEHLRMGTWDLLRGWSGPSDGDVEPRLALQLVHEAALCSTGLRRQRVLSQRGFELANGLPFVASDTAMHCLLAERTIAQTQRLQVALGRIRRASGDYAEKRLAIDPHRTHSYSKRQMRRFRDNHQTKPFKTAPTFFALDPDTCQPVCFTVATAAKTASAAAAELLGLAAEILVPDPGQILVLADLEHLTVELFDHARHTPFDLLAPMKNTSPLRKQLRAMNPEQFTRRWAGFATAKVPYRMRRCAQSAVQFVQRTEEKPSEYHFKAFLCTTDRDEVETLTLDGLPDRMESEHVDPRIPWLYGLKLDFRFR